MLKQIRGAMKSFVVIIVSVPLIIAFAAWGVPEMSQLSQNYAVRVGKSGISGIEVRNEFDRYATNQRFSNDGQFDRSGAIAAGIPNQIVQSLALRSALDQEAAKMGLSIPREEVRQFLQSSDQFKNPNTGKFDNDVLTGLLREYNYSVAEFEDRLRSDLVNNQVASAIGPGGPAPKAFSDALILRETESRDVSILTITDDMAAPAPQETPELLKDYYAKNSAQFMAPEMRTFAAVILKAADYNSDGAVSDEDLLKAYEATKAKYETPERRTVYQLTIENEADAKTALDALKNGAPFEKVAGDNGKTLADATFTEALQKDFIDPKVGAAIFGANAAGDVVGPIEGVFGFTIAQIVAITPATTTPFEEAKAEIAADMQQRSSKKNLFDAIEAIENSRDTGASLADAAAAADLVAIEYGPVDSFSFSSGGAIVAGVPGEVLRRAFELEEGEESDATEFSDGSGYFFVSVHEVTPPAAIPFETVENEVRARWQEADRTTRLDAVVKEVRAAVDSGKTLKEAAAALNRAPIEEKISRRTGNQLLTEPLVEQAFSAEIGEAISGPGASDGAQIVATIDAVSYNTDIVGAENVSMFAQYIGGQLGQELVDAYSKSVLTDSGIKIYQDRIDAQFADGQ